MQGSTTPLSFRAQRLMRESERPFTSTSTRSLCATLVSGPMLYFVFFVFFVVQACALIDTSA